MRLILLLVFILSGTLCRADATVTYLANAGLLVRHGETSILFDPLFRNGFGQYQLLPYDMERDLMAGVAPFNGIDAVFISHSHADHFSAGDIVTYLRAQTGVQLFLPRQAADELGLFLRDTDTDIRGRITALDIPYGDAAATLDVGALLVEAFRIPHSGWPNSMSEVQNLAWRVTLDDSITVLHLGDADTSPVHFEIDEDQWQRRATDAAFPPYWFFTSAKGSAVLSDRLQPGVAVGIHVPMNLPARYSEGLEATDLFRNPGETRNISR